MPDTQAYEKTSIEKQIQMTDTTPEIWVLNWFICVLFPLEFEFAASLSLEACKQKIEQNRARLANDVDLLKVSDNSYSLYLTSKRFGLAKVRRHGGGCKLICDFKQIDVNATLFSGTAEFDAHSVFGFYFLLVALPLILVMAIAAFGLNPNRIDAIFGFILMGTIVIAELIRANFNRQRIVKNLYKNLAGGDK